MFIFKKRDRIEAKQLKPGVSKPQLFSLSKPPNPQRILFFRYRVGNPQTVCNIPDWRPGEIYIRHIPAANRHELTDK